MADSRRDVNRPDAAQPPRRHGLLYNLLWGWPWALAGMVLSSLLLSLLIEYVGITFFWPGQGAGHSEAVMNTELGWLSSEFTRSLAAVHAVSDGDEVGVHGVPVAVCGQRIYGLDEAGRFGR
ncbi:integrating conjugative element membrane protein, PFL_4697 family [Escherichia coli]|uniref:Integrating conjugative element membrane protein, PFL_4697 family n=1 Tax=Escherichia coli TaxID=562 RepID=A0A376KMM0_ECOLX|nr:integrating conjugative element membrane protein, PFL_4697 family [Escherichia coli]